jgi:glycosyltransferase involved in cell wall biosynthesis
VTVIMPLIWQARPELVLVVAGNQSEDVAHLAGPNVVIQGWTPDLRPLWESCRLSVAPIRYGAGMKGKVGESLANGLPVVTTSVGAEGMAIVPGVHALVADSDADFAAMVLQLYESSDLWNRLAANGVKLVEERFSAAVAREALADLLAEAANPLVTGRA